MNEHDPRFQKSRTAIIEAAIELLSSNPDAGMSDIAAAAGVGRATLYRHFESQEVLVKALTLACLDETHRRLAPVEEAGLTGLDAILASIDILIPMADKYRFLVQSPAMYGSDPEIDAAYQQQLDELLALVEAAQDSGELRRDLPASWIVASYDALIYAAWDSYCQEGMTLDELAGAVKATFKDGVAARRS